MGIKSQGGPGGASTPIFNWRFGSTGTDASDPPPIVYPTCSGAHNTPSGASHFWDWSYSHDDQVGSVDFDSNTTQMALNDSSQGIAPPPGWGCGGYGRIATKAASAGGIYRTSQGSIPNYSAGDWTFDICVYVGASNNPATTAWMPYTVNNDGETYGMVHYWPAGDTTDLRMDTVNSDFNGRLGETGSLGGVPTLNKWCVLRFRYDGSNWKNETYVPNGSNTGWTGLGSVTTTKTAGSQPDPSNGEGRILLNSFGTHVRGYGKDNVHYAWAAFYPNDTASVYVPS